MHKTLLALTSLLLLNTAHANEDVVWFYQSFPNVTVTQAAGSNVDATIYDLCRAKSNTDLQNTVAPSYSDGDSAFGHYTAGVDSYNRVNDTTWQCAYGSAIGSESGPFYLYVYAETKCSDGEEYDREKRMCVRPEPECVEGETHLFAGISSPLVQTAPNTVYIVDQTADKTCRKLDSGSRRCSYSKPARSHSCYADSALSWDSEGNLTSTSVSGHCNYLFVNTGQECSTSASTLPDGFGGYGLTPSDDGGFTCADGIVTPGCPDPGNGDGGDGSGSGGDGSGGNGSGGDGGSGGGDTGGGDTDGGNGSGNSGTGGGAASGLACGAALACSGDAIQCAILAQDKKTACAISDLTNVDQAALTSMVSGDKFELEEKTFELTSIFEGTRFLPSQCPVSEALDLSFGSVSFSYAPMCDFAEWISPIVVLCATFMGMLIIFRD